MVGSQPGRMAGCGMEKQFSPACDLKLGKATFYGNGCPLLSKVSLALGLLVFWLNGCSGVARWSLR